MNISGLILGALTVSTCLLGKAALAEEFGNWTVGAGQGYVEYAVRNGPGNSFMFSCDAGATGEGETKRTSIFIEIVGKAPSPKTNIDVYADGSRFQLYSDATGSVPTDCHVCSDNFAALWAKMRKSKQLIVTLANGRSATFKLNGATKALSAKHCTTGFES
jgi:hypothetical protein